MMDIVVANGFVMERCTFFSREYHCCVLHNTRCKCEDYSPRNSKPITNADRIRGMTDKELAELLYAHKCVDCILFSHDCKVEETLGSGKTCDERILDWLREEAE